MKTRPQTRYALKHPDAFVQWCPACRRYFGATMNSCGHVPSNYRCVRTMRKARRLLASMGVGALLIVSRPARNGGRAIIMYTNE